MKREETTEATSVTFQAAVRLRKRALAVEEGRFLGSEEELMEALGVSRPTFRQVARLLAHEQVLTIKRGVGGGFFARRPTLSTVSRAVAAYLNSRQTTLQQVREAAQGVFRMGVELAVTSDNQAARERLARLREKLVAVDVRRPSVRQLLALESELESILGQLSGNPAIELCLTMFNQFSAEQSTTKLYANQPKRMQAWNKASIACVDAILAKDLQAARDRFTVRSALLEQWIAAELGNAGRQRRAAGSRKTNQGE